MKDIFDELEEIHALKKLRGIEELATAVLTKLDKQLGEHRFHDLATLRKAVDKALSELRPLQAEMKSILKAAKNAQTRQIRS